MKVSKQNSFPSNFPDIGDLQSFTISQLFPSHFATAEGGLPAVNSPFSVLVALLSDTARVLPHDVVIRKGEVALIPSAYACEISPEGESQIELAAVDFSFKSNGMDITAALPEVPIVIPGRHGNQLADDVCAICNLSGSNAGLGGTTALLKAGYSIAHTLSQVLGWDSVPELFYNEDSELQALTSYLGNNYHLPLTVEDIASACNVSRRKLFKVAARHKYGTPMRLLKQIRLEQSLPYLRRDELSIGQIASKVGFMDARNYSREFKKHYSQSPQQYRQQSSLNVHTESLVLKADMNLRTNYARRASVLYQQAIESAPQSTDLNRLNYLLGLSLKRAGDAMGAGKAWSNVTTLYYRLLIGLEECDHLDKATSFTQVAERLRRAYDYGDKELRAKVIKTLGDCMMQCASSGKQVAAKHYTRLACELAPGNQILQPQLAKSLYITGQFQEIVTWCPEQKLHVAGALRAMGKYEEHLRQFPEMRQQNALIHLRMGNLDNVLSEYRDLPETCVSGLIDAGRSDEALSTFPDQGVKALLALGKNEEIISGHPDDEQMCAFAHANAGRVEEALKIAASHPDLMARLLLHIERPQDVTLSPSREYNISITRAAKVLQGIHRIESGDYGYAMDIFDSVLPVTAPDHRVDHEFYQSDIIIPLVRYLYQDIPSEGSFSRWPTWPKHFSRILQDYRYYYAQRLWYDVRFILGDATEHDYIEQPYRRDSEKRLSLVKAIKAELHNNKPLAFTCYREFQETLPPMVKVFCSSGMEPVLKAFVRWRISELERG